MKLNVIPTPKGVSCKEKVLFFDPALRHGDFDAEALVFAEQVKKCTGECLTFADNGISTVKTDLLYPGEYRLTADPEGVTVYAFDSDGASYAFATLLQLSRIRDGKLILPALTVWDSPDFGYRGLMIDCARSFHTLDELKKYVDLCYFYKVKYLHIHFSDDESYTLPSEKFPKLSTEGKCFTFAEIAELDEYAASRHVGIIPEVDTPGHSTAILKAYPEIFGKEGIITFSEKAVGAVGDIYREICAMFPHSEYIHIGGDESRLGWWLDNDECTEFGKKCGFSIDDDAPGMTGAEYIMLRYLAYFIKSNAEAVLSCGKRPIVWEGFHKATNGMVPKEAAVMVFDSSYQLPGELLEGGFEIINCSWLPTYVVTPTWFYPPEDCYNWDVCSYGTINDASPYKNGMMRLAPDEKMIGGQLSSWGDTIEKAFPTKEDGHRDELEKIRERLPFISENLWNREKIRAFPDINAALRETDVVLGKLLK